MEVDELVRACQVKLRHGDEIGAAQRMALKCRVELLATPGVASGLGTRAVNGEDVDSEHSLDLLEALFEHARITEENRGHYGDRFPDKAWTLIEPLVLLDGVDPPATHGLRMVYARADIDAPPALALRLIRHIAALRKSDRLPYDPDTEIDRLRTLLTAAARTLHQVLDERIGAYPAVPRAAFTYDVACREEEVCGQIALYWVLDLSAQVRLAAADGFRELTKSNFVDPLPAALLPLLRNWMLADAARTALDVALPNARMRGLFAPLPDLTRRPFVSAPISNIAVRCFHGQSRYETQISQNQLRTFTQSICTLATKLNHQRPRLPFGMTFPFDRHRHGDRLLNSDGRSAIVPPRLDLGCPLSSVRTKTRHVSKYAPTRFLRFPTKLLSQMH